MRYRLTRNTDGIETKYEAEVREDGVYFWNSEPDKASGPYSIEQIEEMFDSIEII